MNAEERKNLKGLFAMLAEAKEILTEKMAITRNREELYAPRVNLMAIAGAINKLATHEAISSLLDDVDRLEAENASLRARVAVLEKVREAAGALADELDRRAGGNDWPMDLGDYGDALTDALDKADKTGKEGA